MIEECDMKKICVFFLALSFFYGFAENAASGDFNLSVDLAYYPLSEKISGETHFSPLSAPYSGIELRTVASFTWTIPTPFSENPLVSGNNLKIKAALELSPVSFVPELSFSFTPIAFLIFSTGIKAGSGWTFTPLSVDGMAQYDNASSSYNPLSPFSSLYYNFWAEALFQFDLAALYPGEWNHIALVATYKPYYEALSKGGEGGNPWYWQGSGEKANGWKYYSSIIFAYQMPLLLQTIAVQTEFEGFYDASSFASTYQAWDPCFTKISISPLVNLEFSKSQNLIILFGFSSRRSFSAETSNLQNDLEKTTIGREWFFNRIALSYSIRF